MYASLGFFISKNIYPFPLIISNSIAFFLIWFVVELVYFVLSLLYYHRIPEEIRHSKYNKIFGVFFGIINGALFVWLALVIALTMPLADFTKEIRNSFFVKKASPAVDYLSVKIANVFGEDAKQAIRFLTLKPSSDERVDLGFKLSETTIDQTSEVEMLNLINAARKEAGLSELVMDEKLQTQARDYGREMFDEGFFSHNDLDGNTPFDRMAKAGIIYKVAGENLAIAENVTEANKGLMASPTHRENILTKEFGKVGIGVVDGGNYGKIFVQEFTD